MKLIKGFDTAGLYDDPIYNLHFEDYEKIGRDCYFFIGNFHNNLWSSLYDDKEKVVLTLEEPNFCVSHREDLGCVTAHLRADKILTLCPYTAETFENRYHCWFPIHEKYIPSSYEKTIDFCYFGQSPTLPSGNFTDYFNKILIPNYKCEFGYWNNKDDKEKVTKINLSYYEKIEVYSKSKFTLIHNICNLWRHGFTSEQHLNFPNGRQNKAFSHLEYGILPQLKSRVFEASISKCLMLCQKDPWNVIEYYFTPDEDFIYFRDEEELKKISEDVVKNYHLYDKIRENAYQKVINNYTTRHFVNKYLR